MGRSKIISSTPELCCNAFPTEQQPVQNSVVLERRARRNLNQLGICGKRSTAITLNPRETIIGHIVGPSNHRQPVAQILVSGYTD